MYASSSSSSSSAADGKYVSAAAARASKYGSYVLELSSSNITSNDRRSRAYNSVPRTIISTTTSTVPRYGSRATATNDINGNAVRSLSLSKSLSPSSAYTAGSLARDTKTQLSLGNATDKRYDSKKRLDAYYSNRSSSSYLNKSYTPYRASNLSYFEKYNKQQQQQQTDDQHQQQQQQHATTAAKTYGLNSYVNMNKKYVDNVAAESYNNRPSASDGRRGAVGIRNIGNTCYMNSVLQCLSHTRALTDAVLDDASSDGKLIRVYRDLLSRIWAAPDSGQHHHHQSAVDTTAFKSAFQRLSPRFAGYDQQDAQEFLRLLLEKLHVDVNRVRAKPPRSAADRDAGADETLKDNALAADFWHRYLATDNSTVVDLFAGQLKSTLECSSCGHKSITFEVFWDLSLPLPPSSSADQVSLADLLDSFTQEEVLDYRERPRCSVCKVDRKMYKAYSFQKLPRYLVLHLKRFQGTQSYKKITSVVAFPLTSLDMSPYVSSSARGVQSHTKYSLYAVSNHSGTPIAGHYTAFCKHPVTSDWNFFNDSAVSKITAPTKLISNEAYILFYEAVNY